MRTWPTRRYRLRTDWTRYDTGLLLLTSTLLTVAVACSLIVTAGLAVVVYTLASAGARWLSERGF